MKKLFSLGPEGTVVARDFWRTFLPVLLLLLGVGAWTTYQLVAARLAKVQSEQLAVLNIHSAILQEDLANALEKLQALVDDPHLAPLLAHDSPALRQRLEESMVTLLLRNRDFDQVRWLDEHGQEQVRVDRREGTPVAVPAAALEDQSLRPYFTDTMRLPAGRILMSPMELSVERGQIAQPFRPTLRLATPIQDSLAQPRGILIIDVHAAGLLERLPRHHFTGAELLWLNEAGDWLRATDPDDEWGFQRGLTDTFARRHPDVWQAMTSGVPGPFRNDQGLWSWSVLDPRTTPLGNLIAQAPRWTLVARQPASTLQALTGEILRGIVPILLVSLLLVAGFSWLQARRRLAVQRAEQNYRQLFESTHEPTLIFSRDALIDINPAGLRLLGAHDRNALIGKTPNELSAALQPQGEASAAWASDLLEQTLTAGHHAFEWRIHRLDDSREVLTQVSLSRITGTGQPMLQAVLRDLTPQQAWEREREALLARLQRIATRVPGVVYEFQLHPDGHSCLPYASEGLREIYRVAPEAVREDAAPIFAMLHPEDAAQVRRSIQASAEALTPWVEDYRVQFADGTVRWLSGNAVPMKQADGAVLWHGFIHDITERKAQEARLQNLSEQLRATVNAALDGIIVMNREGHIVDVNPAAERCFGWPRAAVIGQLLSAVIVPERYRAAHEQGMRHYLATGEGPVLRRRIEIEALRQDGTEFPVELAIDVAQGAGEELFIAYLRDISDRKQAEAELRRNAAQLAAAFERNRYLLQAATDGIHVLDAAGRIILASDAFAASLGYTNAEVIGMPVTQWDAHFTPEELARLFPELLAQTATTTFETRHRRQDGTLIEVEITARGVTLEGQPVLFASARDITARKQTEAELRRQATELRKLSWVAARTDNAVVITDAAGYIEWVNNGFTRMTGWSLPEVLGRKPGGFLQGPETDPVTVSGMAECLHAGRAFSGEILNYHRNGRPYWIALEIQPIVDDAGALIHFIAIERDITERKQLQAALEEHRDHLERLVATRTEELQRNQALLEAVVTTTPNGLLLIDRQGTIRLGNTALERMFGYPAGDLVGRSLEALVPTAQREGHQALRQRYLQHPEIRPMGQGLALRGQRKDGTDFPIDVSLAAFTVNEVQYVQATVTDMSAREAAAAALRELNANLEQKVAERTVALAAASAAKSEFLANMSHEIRTPMNGILALAQLLEREVLTADQLDMVGRIRQAGRSLLGILNDILDFSKIEAGQLKIDRQPFHLASLLAQVKSLLGSTARAKGLGFHLVMPAGLDGALLGDALRLEQILVNLIGNAIKFTERGAIQVRIDMLAQDAAVVRLRFAVSDQGIGIDPQHLATLFKPFTQAEASITRRFGGTGLGLSICQRLVDLMGGEIGVESTLGVGSTFWFALPLARATGEVAQSPVATPPPPSVGPRLTGLHCLVVDDSRMNREVVERALLREGARATLAADGQQALQYLRTQPTAFDAVLMDVQMPVMDGLTATRAIRGELGLADLPVIAFTAGVMAEQRQQITAAGCTDFVAKPVDLEELYAVLLRWTTTTSVLLPNTLEELPAEFPTIPGLDTQQAAWLLGNDQAFFLELLCGFVAEFNDAAALTRADLAQGAPERAAQRLHTLAGNAGNIGATALLESARALETAILKQQPERERLLAEFETQLSSLMAASAPWLNGVEVVR